MKVTLKKAFTLRNRLTKQYDDIMYNLTNTDYAVEVDKDKKPVKKQIVDFDKQTELLFTLGELISDVNAAIDKANANSEARKLLAQITERKRRCSFFRHFVSEMNKFEEETKEVDEYLYDEKGNRGVYVTKHYKPVSSVDFAKELKIGEQQISELEDRLEEVNNETFLELPNSIHNFV